MTGWRRAAPRADLVLATALALSCLALFAPVAHHGFVYFDDPQYVTQNPCVLAGLTLPGVLWSLTAGEAGNWHPLTWVSHMLDVTLFGMRPGPHHTMSLLIHAASAVLLFGFLRRATGARWAAALAAALFAAHPLRVESVAWVAERKDVLAVLFWVLALRAHLARARRPDARGAWPTASWFALALASKPTVVTLPLVLLLLDWWPLGRLRAADATPAARAALSLLREKAPLFLLAAAAAAATVVAQQQAGLLKPIAQFGIGLRLASAGQGALWYLGKTLWPADLAVFYPHPETVPAATALAAGAVLALLSAAALFAARRFPFLFFGWAWFLVTLLPVIGLVQVGLQAVADRYSYLPAIGLCAAMGLGLAAAMHRLRTRDAALAAAGALAVLLSCGVLTRLQLRHWTDSVALFRRAVAVSPQSHLAWTVLGLSWAEAGSDAEAERSFLEALRLRPDFAPARFHLAETYLRTGRREAAARQYPLLRAADRDFAARLEEMLLGAGGERRQ